MTRQLFNIIFKLILACSIPVQITAQTNATGNPALNSLAGCPESAYVHTDREIYVAGENLFFKLYVTPDKTAGISKISSIGYIVLRNQNMKVLSLIMKLKSGSSFGNIYIPDTLKSGMYELVAFTNYMKNFDEKYFYRKELLIINRFDKTLDDLYLRDSIGTTRKAANHTPLPLLIPYTTDIKIILEKDSFKIRDKIKIGLQWNNTKIKKGIFYGSLNVKTITPLTVIPALHLPILKDSLTNNDELNQSVNFNPYYAEEKGVFVRGKISTPANKPLKEECLFISTFDTAANLQYTISNDSGYFQFLLDKYYMGKTLLLKSWNSKNQFSDKKIYLEDKFAMKMAYTSNMPEMSITLKKYLFASQDLVQITKMYRKTKNLVLDTSSKSDPAVFPALYFQPGTVVFPSNYVPLDNFEEISSNILKGFVLRKNKGIYNVYLFDVLTKSVFSNPALVFLDGVYIDDISQIMSLNSDDIEKIEICNNLRMKGILEFPGLVSIITKKHLAEYNRYSSSSLIFRTDNYSEKSTYLPVIADKKSNASPIPDFRQLLYWNPEIELKPGEANYFEFNCSDYFGEYLIELIGYTSEGKQIAAWKKIKVYR